MCSSDLNPIVKIELAADKTDGRSGDVFMLQARALDKSGKEIGRASCRERV